MKLFPFIKWYLRNDYWPDKHSERWSLVLNKGLYLILFLIGFVALGFYGGFQNTIQSELDDPYANSIPAASTLMESLDTIALRADYPQLEFNRITNINGTTAPVTLVNGAYDTLDMNGRAVALTHPYMSIVTRETIWEDSQIPVGQGIYLALDAAYRLGFPLETKPDSLHLQVIDLGIHNLVESLPVKGVCRNLPMGLDLLVPLDFHDRLLKARYQKNQEDRLKSEPSYSWELLVSDSFIPYDSLFIWSLLVDEFLAENNIDNATCMRVYSTSGPGTLRMSFDDEMEAETMRGFLKRLNAYILPRIPSADTVKLSENVHVPDWKPERSWRYFTITIQNTDRSNIFELKEDIEDQFVGINLEMKGFNIVYVLGVLSKNIEMFRNLGLILLIGLSVVINYQVLNHHIHKRRQNIGYLKTVGIDAVVFRQIYLFESIAETVAFALLSLLAVMLIGPSLPPSSFLFRTDGFVATFIGAMLLANVMVYLYLINRYLKISFREMIDS